MMKIKTLKKNKEIIQFGEHKPLIEMEDGVIINDDFSFICPTDSKTYTMKLKQKEFIEKFLEFRGNGTQAMVEVYGIKDFKVAAAMAYEYLRKPHLIAYASSLLDQYGFNDDNVEKQHLYVLNQMADLPAKNKAIEMFYRLRGKLKGTDAPPAQTVNYNVFYNPKFQSTLQSAETEMKKIITDATPIQTIISQE